MKYRIKEVPNRNILCFQVTKKVSSNLLILINSYKIPEVFKGQIPKDESDFLKRLSVALLAIPGVIELSFDRYEISVEKSDAFEWEDINFEVIAVIKRIVAKGAEMRELPRIICTEADRHHLELDEDF